MIASKQIGPDFSPVDVTTVSAGTTTLLTLALADNTNYIFYIYVTAVDTVGNKGEWIAIQTWFRVSGGAPQQQGSDKGPAPTSTIPISLLTGNWITIVPSGNTLVVSAVTSSTAHCKFSTQANQQAFFQSVAV